MKYQKQQYCKNKGCNNAFKPYKTTDKYCSLQCAIDNAPTRQIKKSKIKPYSEKRKKENYMYTKKRKVFLSDPKNIRCIVAQEIFNECLASTEVHHKAGRRGKLLNYVPFWLAVSRKGHEWIHANPEEAIKKGYLIPSSTVNI